MQPDSQEHPIFPSLAGRDRQLCESAIRQLQARGVIADFDGIENADAAELYTWSERNITLLEAYFRLAGLGVRAQHGFPVIQLVLEDGTPSHPLRRRLDKSETGLLICLWILYHERMREVEGFLVTLTVSDINARLSALYRTDKAFPDGVFEEKLRLFERYFLVQTDLLKDDFSQSRIGLLPTLLTTFHFQDTAEAAAWDAEPDDAESSTAIPS